MTEARKHEKYDDLIRRCDGLMPVRTAVVHPCDETSLRATLEAAKMRLIEPIIFGPNERIHALAGSLGLHVPLGIEVIATPHSHASAEKAVELVRAGRADA